MLCSLTVEIKGKLAVVTGGARRLGRSVVEALAARGARPVVHFHQSAEQARQLARQTGGVALQADLARPGGAQQLARAVLDLPGELGAWVNSASTLERVPFLESDDALWERTLRLTLLAPAQSARLVAPRMVDGGVIINLLDVAAAQPWRGHAHHCVAKSALQMLTRCLALELGPRLRACGVTPGLVLPAEDLPESRRQALLRRIPLGRQGQPGDVAAAVCFLLDSDYLTGSVITVDGGLTSAGVL